MTDVRDGKPLDMPLPRGVRAFEQASGEIALWNGRGHVILQKGYSAGNLQAALINLGFYSREMQKGVPHHDRHL